MLLHCSQPIKILYANQCSSWATHMSVLTPIVSMSLVNEGMEFFGLKQNIRRSAGLRVWFKYAGKECSAWMKH